MKVLITTGIYPPDIGGPAIYSKLLFDELPKRGFEVEVLVFKDVLKWPYIIRHIIYFLKILKKGRKVDIIFAQDPLGSGMPAAFAAKILRKKFILKIVGDRAWETGVQSFGLKIMLDEFSKKWIINPILIPIKVGQTVVSFLADTIVTPSNYLRNIVGNWGVRKKKIKVIYNSFDVPESIGGSPTSHRKSDFVLVSAGRPVPWKGFALLRDLMPEIKKEIPNTKLTILERESREKVLESLKAGDLFVLNTGYEGLSHQILEAMALEIPIITTNVGGNPELIENNKSGLLVEYNNKEQIKEAILKLYKDKNLREKFVQNAKEKVKEFSKERMIKETIKILS